MFPLLSSVIGAKKSIYVYNAISSFYTHYISGLIAFFYIFSFLGKKRGKNVLTAGFGHVIV